MTVMDRCTSALVVAALCLLAGCSGFVGGQGDAGVDETVTPAPVPTVEAEPAQGVSENGINAAAVGANHHAALADRNYTTRTRIQWRDRNGSASEHETVHRVEDGGRRFHVVATYGLARADDVTGHELWHDGDRTVLRLRNASGDDEYRRVAAGTGGQYPRAELMSDVFSRLDVRRVAATANGSTVVSGPVQIDDLGGLSQFRDESNATMSARIAPDGHVDRLVIGFDGRAQGGPVDARLVIDVANVGSTTVSEPGWVETWRNQRETPATE